MKIKKSKTIDIETKPDDFGNKFEQIIVVILAHLPVITVIVLFIILLINLVKNEFTPKEERVRGQSVIVDAHSYIKYGDTLIHDVSKCSCFKPNYYLNGKKSN